MNKSERKRLGELIDQIQSLVNEVGKIGQNEQEKFDNLTDNLQDTAVGQYCQDAAYVIKEGCDSINFSLNRFKRIVEGDIDIILPF